MLDQIVIIGPYSSYISKQIVYCQRCVNVREGFLWGTRPDLVTLIISGLADALSIDFSTSEDIRPCHSPHFWSGTCIER